jgi:hypothetical protein
MARKKSTKTPEELSAARREAARKRWAKAKGDAPEAEMPQSEGSVTQRPEDHAIAPSPVSANAPAPKGDAFVTGEDLLILETYLRTGNKTEAGRAGRPEITRGFAWQRADKCLKKLGISLSVLAEYQGLTMAKVVETISSAMDAHKPQRIKLGSPKDGSEQVKEFIDVDHRTRLEAAKMAERLHTTELSGSHSGGEANPEWFSAMMEKLQGVRARIAVVVEPAPKDDDNYIDAEVT